MAYTEGTIRDTNTLAGMLRINDANLSDVEANDVIQPTQFMNALPFVLSSQGTQHKWTVRTSGPGVAFRDINDGVANAAGKEQTITADLKLLDASFARDAASTVQPRMSRDEYLARESMLNLNGALSGAEYQLIQGSENSADGFDGLQDLLNIWGDMGENVGGSGGTRVYMLCLGPDRIAGVLGGARVGEEGNIEMSDPYRTQIDGSSSGTLGAFRVDITGWMGLQIAGSYSGAVAYNIDGTSGKAVDDDLLAELYSKFPSQHSNAVNAILMSRTGLKQLRASRTTDLIPSPEFPTAWGGAGRPLPIIVSDAIDDSEASQTTTTTTTT